MKEIIRLSAFSLAFASLMAASMYLPTRHRQLPASLSEEEISWVEFCKARGYDIHDNAEEIVNEFLDTWRGSVAEEEALIRKGAEV